MVGSACPVCARIQIRYNNGVNKLVDNNELERIIKTYSDVVYRNAMAICHNEANAWDVYQNVFVKLVKHVAELESEEHIKRWLIIVTKNEALSLFNNSWHSKVDYIEDINFQEPADPKTLRNEQPTYASDILDALRELEPPIYREIIYLFYYEEYSIKEISEILEKSEGNIKTSLNRARNKLKTFLEERGVKM